ncbi:MAG: hypothetical protein C5B59_15895 [Bacteroidetes bacterium]|nr:MAG: hypothetical protein C5B59_15895 [Bacteroidota bacterium]
MTTEEKNNRSKWVHIRLTKTEHEKVKKECSDSTSQSLSAFARKKLLGKPITIKYRDRSLDDFVTEMIFLRHHLESTVQATNQTAIFEVVKEVKSLMSKISDAWSQSSTAEKVLQKH